MSDTAPDRSPAEPLQPSAGPDSAPTETATAQSTPATVPSDDRRHWSVWIEYGAVALALLFALAFSLQYVSIAWTTVPYPYHLDWIEGEMLDTAMRMGRGENIYGPPTLDFVPGLYAPLFYVAIWLSGLVFGLDFFAARLVSFGCAIGVSVVLGRWVGRETGSRTAALITGGLWLATYDLSGHWFHVARVDSMMCVLLFGGLSMLHSTRTVVGGVVAGLLLAAACMTKQTVLLVCLPVLAVKILTTRRAGISAMATYLVLFLGTIVVMDLYTDRWFSWWVFVLLRLHPPLLPTSHHTDIVRWLMAMDLGLWPIAILCTTAALGAVHALRHDPRRGWILLTVLGSCLFASVLSVSHSGSHNNSWMPAYAALVLAAGLGLGHVTTSVAPTERSQTGLSMSRTLLCLLLVAQLLKLYYPPNKVTPADGARAKGEKFLAELQSFDGDVLLTGQRWVQIRAGLSRNGLGMGAWDVLRIQPPDHPVRVAFDAKIREALAAQRFAAVITNRHPHSGEPMVLPLDALGLSRFYRLDHEIESPSTVVGFVTRPSQVWLPRDDVPRDGIPAQDGETAAPESGG